MKKSSIWPSTNNDIEKNLPSLRRGCPLLLGKSDLVVQTYIMAASNTGAVITKSNKGSYETKF